jgi:sulfite reductase beta subunit-like hemoprotein
MKGEFSPEFRTRQEHWNKEERNKQKSKNAFEGNLNTELHSENPDLSWEAEQIAKAHGIYLEFDRAHKGKEKDWIYMVRVAIPGGGQGQRNGLPTSTTLTQPLGIVDESRLLGTEDGRNQGEPIFSADGRTVLLRWMPRTRIASLLDVAFRFYSQNRKEKETLGYFLRRMGIRTLLDYIANDPAVADLLIQEASSDDFLEIVEP